VELTKLLNALSNPRRKLLSFMSREPTHSWQATEPVLRDAKFEAHRAAARCTVASTGDSLVDPHGVREGFEERAQK
jgi:hypothetical protein